MAHPVIEMENMPSYQLSITFELNLFSIKKKLKKYTLNIHILNIIISLTNNRLLTYSCILKLF